MRTSQVDRAARPLTLAAGLALAGSALLAPAALGQESTIELWSWNNEGAYPVVHEDAETRYEAANPGVDIVRTYIPYGDYITKFKAAVAADEPPCIAQIPWAGEFRDLVQSGELIPLTEHIGTGFPAFFEPIVSAVTLGGDVWAVPLDVNTLQIAYNQTVFDGLGLSVPQTQSELQTVVDALAGKGLFGIAMGTKDKWSAGDLFFAQVAYTDGTNTKLAQADAGETGWDDPAFRQAADNVVSMVASGVFAPGANSMDAFVGGLELFTSGTAGMFYPVGNFVTAGIASAVGDTFAWSLFPFPRPDGSDLENRATGGIAEMFVVTRDCAAQGQAIDFLRYLVDDAGGAALVANDFIPSWDFPIPADKSPLYQNMVEAQATANSRVIYTTPVYAELLNVMQGVMDGSASGEDVIAALVSAAPDAD
jgi:ABC-type glycerol-3-phosphate transport system substrate-binding protein